MQTTLQAPMQYHDFHLREYRVADLGTRITLDLVYDYAGKPKKESRIEFSDVALYNFTHTGGAIITGIEETSLDEILSEVGASLVTWYQQHGLSGWGGSLENYRDALRSAGNKAWWIDSAIGFHGFVIARSVRQAA